MVFVVVLWIQLMCIKGENGRIEGEKQTENKYSDAQNESKKQEKK